MLDSRHLYSRRAGAALRSAAGRSRRDSGLDSTGSSKMLNMAAAARPADLSRDSPAAAARTIRKSMTALTGSRATLVRVTEQGEHDHLRRRADPALPRGARRPAAVDPGRRHRQDRRRRTLGHPARLRRRGAVIIVLSFLLAGTIANPLRRLSDAAVRVRRGSRPRGDPGFLRPPGRNRQSVASRCAT